MICCIYLHAVIRVFFSVIPANAGVILQIYAIYYVMLRYPRECGGDPGDTYDSNAIFGLSPRMRG